MAYFYLYILIQIVMESLPISSSSHIAFLNKLRALSPITLDRLAYYASLDHVLHGVTACIVTYFFRTHWLFLIHNWRRCVPIIIQLIALTLIADTATAFFFFVSRTHPITLPVPVGLAITASLLYSLRWLPPSKHTKNRIYNIGAALVLGIAQGLAVIPGISRFAIVYITSQWLGFNPHRGFLLTWMIFWPLLVAQTMHGVYQLAQQQLLFTLVTTPALAVLIMASIIGYYAFCFAARTAYTRTLWLFSLYVLLFACIFVLSTSYSPQGEYPN